MISIILPTYNGSRYIKRAIESVLSQSYSDWELLVIDDCSADNTIDVLGDFLKKDNRIIYFKNEVNLGVQKTLNIGLEKSKGEYIARIDDDDEWIDKDKIKKQIDFLDNNKNFALVGTGVVIVGEEGKELLRYLLPEKDIQIRQKILLKNCFIHSSVVYRKDVVLNLGGYRETNESKNIEDYDLWLRIGVNHLVYNLPIYGLNYTRRVNGISAKNKIDQLKKCLFIIKKYKNIYPRFFVSFIFRYFTVVFYKIFYYLFSESFQNKLIKIYKQG